MSRLFILIPIVCLGLSACANLNKKSNTDTKADAMPPKMLAPSVRKVWIPPVLKDGGQEWEEGHYVYRIERGASWSR